MAIKKLGFERPSIIPAVGGGWVFAAKDTHRYKGVVKEGKARLDIFKGFIEDIYLSVHGGCRLLNQVGYSFKTTEEEIEKLIEIVEVAFPVAKKQFGSFGIPITGIVFPPYDADHVVAPPIILDFE